METAEQLEQEIWKRYGSFELSHEKNVLIVKSILEFVLKQRAEYAKFHVEAALKEASVLQRLKYVQGETGYIKTDEWEFIYPLTLIK